MVYLQSDGYQSGHFHKMWVDAIVWMKIRHLKDFAQNLLVAKYQNFVDTLGSQKTMWTTFLEFEFFLSKKTRLQILPG